jgi:hypothetical protein
MPFRLTDFGIVRHPAFWEPRDVSQIDTENLNEARQRQDGVGTRTKHHA